MDTFNPLDLEEVDVSYLESATEVTLLHICASNIVNHIVMNKIASDERITQRRCRTNAAMDLEELRLPNSLKRVLLAYVKDITKDLLLWYRMRPRIRNWRSLRHALNWRGKLDKVEMAKRVVEDESQEILLRYFLACTYCHEMHISKLMKLLSNADMDRLCRRAHLYTRFAFLWFEALYKLAECKTSDELIYSLDPELLSSHVSHAIRADSDAALVYLEKMPLACARDVVFYIFRGNSYANIPLRMLRRLLAFVPEIRENDAMKSIHEYALIMHLKRPDHEEFLDLTKYAIRTISHRKYCSLLERVLEMAESSKKDSSYAMLLYKFVVVSIRNKQDYFLRANADISEDWSLRELFARIRYILVEVEDVVGIKTAFRNLFD